MSNDFALGPREIKAALAVLEREQAAHLPTRRQNTLYRAFNLASYAMALVVLLWLLEVSLLSMLGGENLAIAYYVPGVLFLILGVTTSVLFGLNWGLIRKLYRQAKLRRRLKLAYYLRPAFRAQRRATRLKNAVTMSITALGIAMILLGLPAVALSFLLWIDGGFLQLSHLEFAIFLSASLAWTSVGFGLASLHFMRRGKERLEIVTRLQEMLAKQATELGQDAAATATLSASDYEIVASMEREQIIKHRASSIISGRKEAASSSYLCLSSRQMNDAKSRLSRSLLSKVDETILSLLTDPMPSSSQLDPQTGNRMVRVPDTGLRIEYDVNVDRHLVRLRDLQGSTV
jgi:hypothetical protein